MVVGNQSEYSVTTSTNLIEKPTQESDHLLGNGNWWSPVTDGET